MMNAALHDICTRIARLETERKELAAEVAKIKKQAKEDGYDAGLITKTVAIMLKTGKKQREALEQHELFDTYLNAVGLLSEDRIVAVAAERLKPGDPVVINDGIASKVSGTVSFGDRPPVDLNDTEAVKREMGAFVAKVGAGFTNQPQREETYPDPFEETPFSWSDPITGELHTPGINADPPATHLPGGDDADPPPRSAGGQVSSSPAGLAASIDMGDIPEALRRARVA